MHCMDKWGGANDLDIVVDKYFVVAYRLSDDGGGFLTVAMTLVRFGNLEYQAIFDFLPEEYIKFKSVTSERKASCIQTRHTQ